MSPRGASSTVEPDGPAADTAANRIAVGTFFLAWAAVGWASVAGNPMLFSDLYAGLDPGPSLMPLAVLSIVTAGGLSILAGGLVRRARRSRGASREEPSPASGTRRQHAIAAALLATLLVYPTVMQAVGFAPATVLFTAAWVFALTPFDRVGPLRGLAAAAVAATVITGIVWLGFVVVIRAPLP